MPMFSPRRTSQWTWTLMKTLGRFPGRSDPFGYFWFSLLLLRYSSLSITFPSTIALALSISSRLFDPNLGLPPSESNLEVGFTPNLSKSHKPGKPPETSTLQTPGLPTPTQHIQQYDILITKRWMKTLAIRSDFDFKFSGFRALILGFKVLGFVVLESKQLKPYGGIWACQRICGICRGQT